MNKKTFKRVGELHDGINATVELFLRRAKSSSRDAREALQEYRAGVHWRHEMYLRYRSDRAHWIYAAKTLLLATTNGVVHNQSNARCVSRILERQAAEKLNPVNSVNPV